MTTLETRPAPRSAGSPAADFILTATDGQTYNTKAARANGLLLLAMVKTGCGTCKYAYPYIQRFHEQYAVPSNGRFQVWGVSQDDAEKTVTFAQENGNATFPALLDPDLSATGQYGITNVPDLYLLDEGDTIQAAIVGHFSTEGYNDLGRLLADRLGLPYTPIVREEDDAPALKPG